MQDGAFHPPDPVERSARAGFAVNRLNRMSERRDDAAFIEELRQAGTTRSLVLAGDTPVLKCGEGGYQALFTVGEAAALGLTRETAFLGFDGAAALFATLVEAENPDNSQTREDLAMIDLRSIATQDLVPVEIVGALGQAKSLMHWHARHRFCSNCGAPSRVTAAGWRRSCEACGAQHFPRIDPVVIMLVVDGADCLLGRHASSRHSGYAEGMYSCLAGFVESGETFEDAVRREVAEEVGIKIGRVDYLASQPWPFPASLMIGCIAQAAGRELLIDAKELEDARWFTREEAALMLRNAHPQGLACPPKLAIANLLMATWVAREAP
jgi:NAD+ diphosphatase